MLKHKDIIAQLDLLQKAAIVSSAFREAPFEEAGVPVIRRAELEELAEQAGVSYPSAARAWDPALLGHMTQELAYEGGQEGARLFVTPDLKTAVDPHAAGLSEDGYFNGLIGGAAIRAVHAVGGAAALSKFSLTAEETAYLDRREDAAAVFECVIKPFAHATAGNGCEVVISDPTRLGTGYYHTNRGLFRDVLSGAYGDAFAVGEGDPDPIDAVRFLRGKASVDGIAIPLQRALRRYAQLAVYEKEGSVSRHDLEESLRDGSALDEERLDEAVDEIIDFALRLEESEIRMPSVPQPVQPVQPIEQPVQSVQPQVAEAVSEAKVEEAAEGQAEQQPAEAQPAPAEEAAEAAPEGESAEEPQEEKPAEETAGEAEAVAEGAAENAENSEAPAAPAEVPADVPVSETPVAFEAPAPDAYAPIPEVPADAARRRVAEACIVLTKNDGLLPLARGTRIAVLGEAYRDLSALRARFKIVGMARGYERDTDRSDELIPEAIRATNRAEAVLVFLYPDGDGREMALPANRIALLGALQRAKKRVIALVCGDRPVDMRFDGGLAASFVVPPDGPYAGEALARVLSGEVNPSGRLTRTAYDNADAYFRAYRADRDTGRMHVGALTGYRRYVTAGEQVRYPFGYGLSYSKFVYSNLRIDKNRVTFTLANAGSYDGCEVVQIYMGAPETSGIAPKRELIAFRKVFLRAGESRTVEFLLPAESFATFDRRLYTENVETGIYRVFVGASVLDIRLQGKLFLYGVEREPVPGEEADFFPNGDYDSVEKVGGENRVTGDRAQKPDTLHRIRRAVLTALPALGVLLFILFTVLILSYVLDYTLLSAAGQETMEWILYVAAIAVLGLIPIIGSLNKKRVARLRAAAMYAFPVLFVVCFVLGAVLISPNGGEMEEIALRILSCITIGVPILAVVATLVERDLWHKQNGQDHWDKFYFERKHDAPSTSETEFEEAFRKIEAAKAAEDAAAAAKAEKTPEEEAPVQAPRFYDKLLTYDRFIADCKTYVTERGLDVSEETLRDYLGAISATQLIFVPAGKGAVLAELVADYFGKKAYIDNAEKYQRYDDLLLQWRQSGRANMPTAFNDALGDARFGGAYLHTAIIRHVPPTVLGAVFSPVVEVLAHRRLALPLAAGGSMLLPPNLVIVAEIEEERIFELPAPIGEVAAVLSPVSGECEPAERKTLLPVVGYERFSAMRQTVRDDFVLPEASWRNVDLLQTLCKSAYFGNRLWLKLEYHAAVVAACGGEAEAALDCALAAELLPWLKAVWKDDACGKTLPEALTEIFGEKNIRLGLAAIAAEEEQ